MDVDISFAAEFDLAPLAAAVARRPERDGAAWLLRERLAHLGLAQGSWSRCRHPDACP